MADERFTGTVKGGKVIFDQPTRWRGAVARHEAKRVELTLAREKKARSLKANAYLWGVVYRTIAEWSGHDEDELHEVFKGMFLPARELMFPTGEAVEARGSTKVLDSFAFAEYVSKVKLWAAEQGVHVPEPDEMEVGL